MAEKNNEIPQNPEITNDSQKAQCIFCQIIAGRISSRKVYEDDKCIAILDINPANPGHTLLLPKEHHPILPMIPEQEMTHLFTIAKRISATQIKICNAEGTTTYMANGAAAGQKVPHFMIHIIPRKIGDGITAFDLPKKQIMPEDQKKIYDAIKKATNERFGIVEKKEQIFERPALQMVEAELPANKPTPEEDRSHMINIPPPDKFKPAGEPKDPSKKTFDLDSITKLFK